MNDLTLDRFQHDAIAVIDGGESVLVSAPTGSGKTLIAEHALELARRSGRRAFYTTPIKALSNQKFHDLVALHGADAVGLLTGDTAINGDAPIVVMTTEVLRNMIYARSRTLDSLAWVVLDEVHYLQDSFRGPVWEEVIIHLPRAVRLVCLSATVSNAEELGEWIREVRGSCRVVVETQRPVELDSWYLVDERGGEGPILLPTFVDGRPNDRARRLDTDPRDRARPGRRRYATPGRVEVVELLRDRSMLPAIHFIFSRAGCDDAVRQCSRAGLRFTDDGERRRIEEIVELHVDSLSDDDLRALDFDEWFDSLRRGIASHHAGLVPPFKEAVERCFVEGLVKVVFATETLALGINMPARTVVIERLTKYTGERHEFLTPAQFTQLTGRAGRRGIDSHGNAIVLWSPFVPFDDVAALAGSRSFRLTSSFRPTYNMAANLVRRYDAGEAHRLLGLSFAQFQSDAGVVALERRREGIERRRDDALLAATCERGDVGDYRRLLDASRSPKAPRSGTSGIDRAMRNLRPGDVVLLDGPDDLRVAIVSVSHRKGGSVRLRAVAGDGSLRTLGAADLDGDPVVVGRVDLPTPFAPTDRRFQVEVASRLRTSAPRPPIGQSRTQRPRREDPAAAARVLLETHPVHGCPDRDRHLRGARDLDRIERELADVDRRITHDHQSLVEQFDRILTMLEDWGHLDGWSLTERGERLVRIFHESDLLIAEAIEEGLLDDLDAATLAGLASAFVYESRGSGPELEPWFPSGAVARRADDLADLATAIATDELRLGLPPTRPPDPSFFGLAHAWASGDDLARLLDDEEMPGGDFVRTIKQLVDLLRQFADTDGPIRSTAREASESLFRGVIAASTSSPVVDAPDGHTDGAR